MFEASEALQKIEGMKKIKSILFHQYSWNSEVETIWISLIGWHHKTSINECMKVENVLQSVKSLNATKIKKAQASCGWITFLLEAQSIVSGAMVVLVQNRKIIPITV